MNTLSWSVHHSASALVLRIPDAAVPDVLNSETLSPNRFTKNTNETGNQAYRSQRT